MKGWETKTIGDVCTIVNGGTPKTGVSDYWDGAHLWITPAEMGKRPSPYADDTARKLTDKGLEDCSAKLLPPHSVILSSRAPIGHLVINTAPMATNQGCKGLIPGRALDHKFLFYYLGSIVDHLNDLGTGATFKELSGGKLKEVGIPLPALDEQRRIVAILDEAFAGLAVMRQHAEANLKNAHALFDSHLNAIFSERGEGWLERRFGEICENLDSRRVPITKRDRNEGSIPYYGASGIVDYVEEYIFDENILLVSEDGANLIARTYPIAFSVSGKCWVNNHAHVVRFDEIATQKFVELYLNSISLEPFVSGMAQPKLNQKALNSIPIPLPDLRTQEKLVAAAYELISGVERLESLYRQKLAAIDELKQAILHRAFSGQLTGEAIAA